MFLTRQIRVCLFSQNCEIARVRPSATNSSALTGRIFMKCDILVFFENLSIKPTFHQNPTRITAILGMKNVLHKSCRENQNTFCQ